MATITTPWVPTSDEVRRIVAELGPVIDECVSRSRRMLGSLSSAGPDRLN